MKRPLSAVKQILVYALLFFCITTCIYACNSEKKTQSTDTTVADSSTFTPPNENKNLSESEFKRELSKFDSIHVDGEVLYLADSDRLLSRDELLAELNKSSSLERKPIGQAIMLFDPATNDYVKWVKFPIRFCIDKASFSQARSPGAYDIVKAAVDTAVRDWESSCGVKFQYLGIRDKDKNLKAGPDLDFIISFKNRDSLKFVATSFFPESGGRTIFILPKFIKCDLNKSGVFRHELGHVLGFRHEESYSTDDIADYCRQPSTTNQQPAYGADYDALSVMHYFCGGKGTKDFMFSQTDKEAFLKAYPKKQ